MDGQPKTIGRRFYRRGRAFLTGIPYAGFKRWCDFAAALALLVLLAPVFLAVFVFLLAAQGAPVFFAQTRAGKHGKPFRLRKFRTMRPPDGGAPPEQRITPAGRLLRRASLDELPQLFNVLRGDMSLVGPRPLLPRYLPRYSETHRLRHAVRPGITGWAQLGDHRWRDWAERLDADAWYVRRRSLGLDLRILLKTVIFVFRRPRASAEGRWTEFRGYD